MGLFSGWQSAVSSAAQVIANLVGQDIVARSISLSQAASSVAVQLVNGARLKLGTGTTDYLTSDGATKITAAGDFTVGSAFTVTGGINTLAGSADVLRSSSGGKYININEASGVEIFAGVGNRTLLSNNISITGSLALSDFLDDSANTGNRTSNHVRGFNAFAATSSSVTITNSFVTTSSQILVTLMTNDATALLKNVVPGSGSFVVTLNANTTAITKFAWAVLN